MNKKPTDSNEQMEASYLQTKFKPITVDEVIDFWKEVKTLRGVDDFNERYSHSSCPKVYDEVLKSSPSTHKPGSYRFQCRACDVVFLDKYLDESPQGKWICKPACPECGRRLWVEEIQ